ncbi:class I SAM-dependent methyltransferase [Dietzia cinnamea]|uniref:Class I SAM-dependent methyltransferase n=1 Tax=Dietzia cinnamea TaxID=321318 RepID=A0AAW5Q618_9ACTN|nr:MULTISPECIES: class I SAM-dependent methyltransferase [Dietzia]MCT1862804.1 class I SAM-dependent methyltransferase [Dietzia cinnamea]MCT2028558.1 class I SAM-dependent methyltransferase [Dietzia cinnamea]MCT2032081.1 class I SAM-dependent methyltransferase [Dietzia cinnamea]MCT2076257.1 class I SAM-dependent methyltransferase [Dietzia cinnamea]MCT2104942.1 class I SAM-dependent methyltransferase [Dietzia cinnamea]
MTTQPPSSETVPAEVFDAVALAHDHMRWDREPGTFDASVLEVLEGIAASRRGKALFLGCGSGREAASFSANGWDCVLVDYSPTMLELARERLGTNGIEFVLTSVDEYLDTLDDRFDFVSMVGEVLGYVPDPPALLAAAASVVDSLGVLIVTWADADRLGVGTLRGDVASFHEKGDLHISAWTAEIYGRWALAAGLAVGTELGAYSESPRRCWIH